MKQFVAKVGGRYTYKEDWENMQGLALSVAEIFSGCNPFIISGCVISGTTGNNTISSGYVWMSGKIRYFVGKTGVNLATGNFLVEKLETKSVKYTGGGTREGVDDYSVIWSASAPAAGVAYITIPNTGIMPNINDEFFGKYAILSNTKFNRQTINKKLQLNDGLDVVGNIAVGNGSNKSDISLSRKSTLGGLSEAINTITADGVCKTQYKYDGNIVGEMSFDSINKTLTLSIDGLDQITATSGGVGFKSVTTSGSVKNGDITIAADSISRSGGNVDGLTLKINDVGYNGVITRFRDTAIYNGKGVKVGEFLGQTSTFAQYGQLLQKSNSAVGLKLMDSTKVATDNSFTKHIAWADKNDSQMLRIGYLNNANNDAEINNAAIGDVIISPKQYLKVNGIIYEGAVPLSAKYAPIGATSVSLETKVDKDGAKILTDVNFTSALKLKIDGINKAESIVSGNQGYATSDQVHNGLLGKMNLSDNLGGINAEAGRAALGVQSTISADTKYLTKAGNLGDLVDKNAARIAISAAHEDASYKKADQYKKSDLLTSTEINALFQPKIEDTGWMSALNPSATPNFQIKVRRIGNMVNIIGTAQNRHSGIWFRVPNGMAPPFSTGQVTDVEANDDKKYNRGMMITCEGETHDFIVRQESYAKSIQYVNITYFVY